MIPPKPNDAPIITSLTTAGPRVEANEEVAVAASVEDVETPIDQLSYQWSAAPVNGEFVGAGRSVRWRAPRLQRTPDLYSLSLLVTETYTSAGRPAENKVLKSVAIHYNDSPTEITHIGTRFLTELFPEFSVSPQAAVQDFSDSCRGKADELSDVTNNRVNFHILSGTYTDVAVDLDADKTFADVSGLCTFIDVPADPSNPFFGKRESVSGVCTLTAVDENWRWFLVQQPLQGARHRPARQGAVLRARPSHDGPVTTGLTSAADSGIPWIARRSPIGSALSHRMPPRAARKTGA